MDLGKVVLNDLLPLRWMKGLPRATTPDMECSHARQLKDSFPTNNLPFWNVKLISSRFTFFCCGECALATVDRLSWKNLWAVVHLLDPLFTTKKLIKEDDLNLSWIYARIKQKQNKEKLWKRASMYAGRVGCIAGASMSSMCICDCFCVRIVSSHIDIKKSGHQEKN